MLFCGNGFCMRNFYRTSKEILVTFIVDQSSPERKRNVGHLLLSNSIAL